MYGINLNSRENLRYISESLTQLGFPELGQTILDSARNTADDPLAAVRLALQHTATEKQAERFERCLRLSKMGEPVYLSNLLTYKVRQLDVEYIQHLGELEFVEEKRNLIIWGSPGTGKTWMAKALATRACQRGYRTRWVTYPYLCRELMRLRTEDSRRFDARLNYYSNFELLCIDEFPNSDIEDKFIMQEFFNLRKLKNHSTIVSGQSEPRNWDALFEVKSFAQSIRGRLLENACLLEMKGPDLRTYDPSRE